MSTRERWIVYPLLFLTLGIALRDKVLPPIHQILVSQEIRAGTIQCGQIEAQRATFESLSSDKASWKEVELDEAAFRLRLHPSEGEGKSSKKNHPQSW